MDRKIREVRVQGPEGAHGRASRTMGTLLPQLTFILLLGLYLINVGYAFEGSFTRLSDFTFISRTLAGSDSIVDGADGGNRFAQTWLGRVPVPLPANYVRGIDLQKADFEQGLPSYLFGRWSDRGWWYYYIVCAVLKVPFGTWVLLLLAMGYRIMVALRRQAPAAANKGLVSGLDSSFPPPAAPDPTVASQISTAPVLDSRRWTVDSSILLLPALAVFVLASSQTGISRHFRYVLPAFPFVFIWISQVASVACRKPRTMGVLVVGALLWMVVSSLSVYPHSMSYFNELAGGPRGGHRYLLDSNIDWGQDVLYLKDWCEKHPEARPLHVLFRNSYSQDLFGIDNEGEPPAGPSTASRNSKKSTGPTQSVTALEDTTEQMPWQTGPRPGWYACSIHRIHDPSGAYLCFLRFKPIATAGYSIYIYHIALDEANRVRHELGLPELPVLDSPDRAGWLTESSPQSASRNNSDRVPLRIAIFDAADRSADATKNLRVILDSQPEWSSQLLDADAIRAGGLERFDLVIFPGGSGSRQAAALSVEGAQSVREFVRTGGGYVGICGGAFLATAEYPWSLALINAKTLTGQRYVPGVGSRSMAARGAGTVQIELTDTGQEFFKNSPRLMDIRYSGGPILSPAGREDLPPCVPLAVYRSELWQYEPERGTMIDTPAIIAGKFGKGRVIAFSPHAETTQGLETLVKSAMLWAARRSALPQHQYKATR